jgi:adenylate kinase
MIPAGNRESEKANGSSGLRHGVHGRGSPSIVVVGVCGSGKSLLTESLAAAGYDARPVAQEHSLVQHLFLRNEPDIVICLEASNDTVARRKSTSWEPRQLNAQRERLKLARKKADIVLDTDGAGPDELLFEVCLELERLF